MSIDTVSPRGHSEPITSRRDFLGRAGSGFGSVALAQMLLENPLLATDRARQRPPSRQDDHPRPSTHHLPRAKRVIFLFMDGGPSHLDLFDRKPALQQYAGQPLPPTIERPFLPMGETNSPILPSPRTWRRYGESGIEVSDWMPHVGSCIDDIALIRSCQSDALVHLRGVCMLNTGAVEGGRPSLGSWAVYGLGSESQNLPAFVVMLDNVQSPPGGAGNWGTGFMPATYQGTLFRDAATPLPFVGTQDDRESARQQHKLDLIGRLNRLHARGRANQSDLEARIASYELAFRMQSAAPEAVDLSQESRATKRLYGLDDDRTATYGRMCLLARRLVERGVRFVQLYNGSGSKWDAHEDIEKNHSLCCASADKPIAGLLTDLKSRGLLADTLVVWGGEFGRTPQSEKGTGRDHNPFGFTMWMAGGGVRGGQIVGASDDFGLHAVQEPVHVHDIHATILHLLGLDHERLTFRHNGRDDRLTDVYGHVVESLLA